MAPTPIRKSIAKDKIGSVLAQAKTQNYFDPAARGPGLHTIRTISWSPTGNLIATGSVDRTLRIWNPDKPAVKNSTELRGHTGAVERVAWNPTRDGELASVSHDGTAKFWDVRSRICLGTVQIGGEGLTIAYSPDGRLVVVGRKDDVLVMVGVPQRGDKGYGPGGTGAGGDKDLTGGYVVHEHIPQSQQTNQVIFAPLREDSTRYTLLLTTGSGTIKICSYPMNPSSIYDPDAAPSQPAPPSQSASNVTESQTIDPSAPAPSLTLHHILPSHTSSCFCLELSPTSHYLATGGSDALICLWDTTDWTCKRTLDKMAGAVRGLGFSWDGAYVVGSSDEGTGLEIAHVESGEYVFTVDTKKEAAPCVAWHPQRYWLAYSGESGGLRIFGAGGGGI